MKKKNTLRQAICESFNCCCKKCLRKRFVVVVSEGNARWGSKWNEEEGYGVAGPVKSILGYNIDTCQ